MRTRSIIFVSVFSFCLLVLDCGGGDSGGPSQQAPVTPQSQPGERPQGEKPRPRPKPQPQPHQGVVEEPEIPKGPALPPVKVKDERPQAVPGLDPRDFKVKRDSFRFSNFGARDASVRFDAESVERLCGPGACIRGSGSGCRLTSAAQRFMENAIAGSRSGNCEGISILAQALYMKRVPLSRYDASASQTYDLKFANPVVIKDIFHYTATIATYPASEAEKSLTPVQVLEEVKRTPESDTIGLYDHNFGRGHSVVGIRVIDDDDEWARIVIYDNNYPEAERHIHVNKRANTWEYDDYQIGDGRTKTMTVIPLSPRLVTQRCPFSGFDDDFEAKDSSWQVQLSGPGHLQAPDDAKVFFRRTAKGHATLDPIYEMKPQRDIELFIRGEGKTSSEPTSVVVYRAGQAMMLSGIVLQKGQIDTLKLGKDGGSFSYSTRDRERVVFNLSATYKDASYEIIIKPKAVVGGLELKVQNHVDAKDKQHALVLQLTNKNGTKAAYSVEMTYINKKSDERFTHKREIAFAKGDSHRLHYGKWLKDKQPLSILVNGKEELLNDED